MNTEMIRKNSIMNDVPFDDLLVKETLATGVINGSRKKQAAFTQADLWNCRRQAKIRRRAIYKIL